MSASSLDLARLAQELRRAVERGWLHPIITMLVLRDAAGDAP